MTGLLEPLAPEAASLFDGLVRASLHGAVFVLLVWAVCRLLPRLPASMRCTLWWLAALKLLVVFVWVDPLALPVLKSPMDALSAGTGPLAPREYAEPLPIAIQPSDPDKPAVGRRNTLGIQSPHQALKWPSVAAGLWAATLILLSGTLVRRIRNTSRIARRAVAASPEVQRLTEDLSTSLGLTRTPAVRVSNEVDTPLVLGFFHPVVLLPSGRFNGLPEAEQCMALCHELMHVRRRDPWLACVPALAERLFFFHPLAHLAVREYGLAREAACDAAVLRELDARPGDYGRLLLALGVTRMPAHFAAAGAPRSYSNLRRRITMLRDISTTGKGLRKAAWIVTVIAACAIVPVEFVAKPAEPGGVHQAISSDSHLDPALPESAAAVASPELFPNPESVGSAVSQRAKDLTYVLFIDDRKRTMSGSEEDVARAERLRRPGERMLWFRRGGREYVVRDPALLKQVVEIFKPLEEIGSKQGEIGAKQGEIGARQGQIGSKQGEIGVKQGEIGARQGRIGSRQAALAAREAALATSRQEGQIPEAQAQELEKQYRELEAQMEQLNRQMQELNVQMQTFNEPMNELSRQMNVLSKEMNVLSRKMEEAAAKAEADLRTLLDRAVATGAATEVK